MTESAQPVVVEQKFEVSSETLWRALTERDQLIAWFFDNIPAFEPVEGFKTEFTVSTDERDFHHLWTITESVPGSKIVYDWRYKDLPGVGKVTFEIWPEGSGSRLRVTNEGLETFPPDIPEFSRESCVGGWKYLIQENLPDYLSRDKQ